MRQKGLITRQAIQNKDIHLQFVLGGRSSLSYDRITVVDYAALKKTRTGL